jgi:RimJ/RimL family protein N-acetyltransferase
LDENQRGIKLVEQNFNRYPWLFETNSTNCQKKNYATLAEELEHVKPILEHLEFKKIVMKRYTVLQNQSYSNGAFSIVPIRFEDRIAIMQWRNEQLYHLRQQKPLTVEDQDSYFNTIVAKLFEQDQPNQILFSFLEDGVCIGYGGLVHINWIDKNAEISFIMNTVLEKERFHEIWSAYLVLLEEIAFRDLKLHKIYTYAFDIRPHLYDAFLNAGFREEARLKEHSFFENKFIDVVIHSKIN